MGGAAVFKKIGHKGEKSFTSLPVKQPSAAPTSPSPKSTFMPKTPIQQGEPSFTTSPILDEVLPSVDRIHQLFTTNSPTLPIVETISYSSSVPWVKGRPAWIADYAAYYQTSRHFIARSLNAKPDYMTQNVATGNRFNVFRKDKRIQFYLLVSLAECKMGLYYLDLDTQERVLLKTYRVGLGALNPSKSSGSMTPLGIYSLGNSVAIYKPGITGLFHDKTVEMIRVYGTRWIPFEKEIESCTEKAKGFGLHGAPWVDGKTKGQLIERRDLVGNYTSDGSIRLYSEDIEELFSIVITKPTYIILVKNLKDAHLPGKEVALPK
jgi:hypothetical protein